MTWILCVKRHRAHLQGLRSFLPGSAIGQVRIHRVSQVFTKFDMTRNRPTSTNMKVQGAQDRQLSRTFSKYLVDRGVSWRTKMDQYLKTHSEGQNTPPEWLKLFLIVQRHINTSMFLILRRIQIFTWSTEWLSSLFFRNVIVAGYPSTKVTQSMLHQCFPLPKKSQRWLILQCPLMSEKSPRPAHDKWPHEVWPRSSHQTHPPTEIASTTVHTAEPKML